MTNKQKQIAFRVAGHVALALGVFSAYKTHSGWGALALVLGIAAMVLAVAEVMTRQGAKLQADVEQFRERVRVMKEAMRGTKPKPPGVEYIREGSDPVERP